MTNKLQLAGRLSYLLKIEKLYLNSDLNLNGVAQILHTNRTYLTEIVQTHFDTSFNSLINSYRVEEARKHLENPANQGVRIEEVAQRVGFNSKSSFNIAFKRCIGTTPSEYRRKRMQKHLTSHSIFR